MATANDDKVIDTSAMKDEAQVPRVSAAGRDDAANTRPPSSKVERQDLDDFNLWHTVAVREGMAVENDTINEKIRHAFKGEGKDKKELGQWNYGEGKGWIETSEETIQNQDVQTESRAKSGDLQAQQRLADEDDDSTTDPSDASAVARRNARQQSKSDLSRRQSVQGQA